MRARAAIGLAGAASALVLGTALAFQYLGGLAPCPLCIWQRWPHGLAVLLAIAAAAWTGGRTGLAWIGVLLMLGSVGLGLFHAGVEQGWWEGLTACAGAEPGTLSTDELLDSIMAAPLVRCDEIAWSFLGLSMAAWNAVLSLGLAGLWLQAARDA